MHNLKLISLAIFLTISFSSQSQTLFSGKIENLGKAPLTLILNNYRGIDTTLRTQTNSEGEFNFEIKLSEAVNKVELQFYKGFLPIALKPGYDLYASFDANNYLQTLKFKGKGAALNQYLFEKEKSFGVRKGLMMFQRMKDLPFESFREERKQLLNSQREFLNPFEKLTENERELEKNNLEYEYHGDLLKYFWVHDYYNQRYDSLTVYPEVLKQTISRCPKADAPDQSFNENYISFLIEYFNALYLSETITESGKVELSSILADDFLLFLKEKSDSLLTGKTRTLYQEGILPKIKYLTALQDPTPERHLFSKVFKYFSKGEKNLYPPLIHISELNKNLLITDLSNHQKSSLKDNLEALRGKTIYLDFWTTWCRPCIANIPASNKLQSSISNKDVVFINICLGKKERHISWMNIVEEKGWNGHHYFFETEDFMSGPINQFFSLSGYPTYIIVDHNGYLHFWQEGPNNARSILEKYAQLGGAEKRLHY